MSQFIKGEAAGAVVLLAGLLAAQVATVLLPTANQDHSPSNEVAQVATAIDETADNWGWE